MYLSTEQARSNVFEGWGGGQTYPKNDKKTSKKKKQNQKQKPKQNKNNIYKNPKKNLSNLENPNGGGEGGGVHEPLTIFTVTVMLISLFLFVP